MKKNMFVLFAFVISMTVFCQPKVREISGKVVDKVTGDGVKNVSLELFDNSKMLICILKTDELGKYRIRLAEEVFMIKAEALNYNQAEVSFVYFKNDESEIKADFWLNSFGKIPEKETLNKEVLKKLPIVSFDFNSSFLNEDNKRILGIVTKFLNDNPQARLRINGYSDINGKDKYNNWLAERRVKRIMNWLIEKEGISSNRLELSYFGNNSSVNYNLKTRDCSFEIIK